MLLQGHRLFEKPAFLLAAGAIVAILVFFINLGSDGIYAPQEGRTALIVRQMIRSGNFMDMDLEHTVKYEKPIGHYWLCLPSSILAGLGGDALEVPVEWAIRFPSAVCALFVVLIAGALAFRLYGVKTSALTMVVLSLSPTFSHLGRLAHIDMPLACTFAAAMYFLYRGYFEEFKSNKKIYLFYLMLGLGVLLKGPLPVLLAGCVILGMLLWSRRWKMLRELRPLTGSLVLLAVALPWYIAEHIRTNGAFFDEFIVNQNFRRFTGIGSTYRGGRRMPVYYYFPKLLAGFLPWSLAVFPGLFFFRKPLWKLRFRTGTVFLIMWTLTLFIFFSGSALKRGDYLLPLYPALAILLARTIVLGCEKLPALSKHWLKLWLVLCVLLAAAAVVNYSGVLIRLGDYIAVHDIPHVSQRDGMTLAMISRYINQYYFFALAGVFAVAGRLYGICHLMEKRRYFAALTLFTVIVFGIFTCYHALIQPGTDYLKTVKSFCRDAVKAVPPGEKILHSGDFNTELIFFMDRPYTVDSGEPVRFVLASPESAEKIHKDFPGVWKELCRTPEKHQYPAVLLEKTK